MGNMYFSERIGVITMPWITVHTHNPIRAALYGEKPDGFKALAVQKVIGLRSYHDHTEKQLSERYGGISCSATMMDGCKCFRFKMIGYSHPEFWDSVRLWVTDEQEDAMFAEACRMADLRGRKWLDGAIKYKGKIDNLRYYGPNALKYDLMAVSFSFISKRTWWRPSKTKVFCTESVFILLLIAFPDILTFNDFVGKGGDYELKPDQLTPSLGDMIVRDYARKAA